MNQSQNTKMTNGKKSRAIFENMVFTPCGAGDSLLEAFTIAAINADFGNVIVFSPDRPSSGSFKKARGPAGRFERGASCAPQGGGAGHEFDFSRRAVAKSSLIFSRNGRREFSLRWNFSEEKIPAPNKQPKINITSNRKDALSAYPK